MFPNFIRIPDFLGVDGVYYLLEDRPILFFPRHHLFFRTNREHLWSRISSRGYIYMRLTNHTTRRNRNWSDSSGSSFARTTRVMTRVIVPWIHDTDDTCHDIWNGESTRTARECFMTRAVVHEFKTVSRVTWHPWSGRKNKINLMINVYIVYM